LVISALFTITAPTCYGNIAWNMQPNTKTIHAIKVFNRSPVVFKVAIAIQATMTKSINDQG
jgi:hypothetical protein